MDPAKGFKKMKHQEFKSIFKEVVIILSPITNIVNYKKQNKLFDIFFKIFNKEKKLIFNIFVSSIILTIVSIISSFYIKSMFNIVEDNVYSIFVCLITIFSLINILKVITNYLRSYYENYLNKNIDTKLFSSFLNHIYTLPLNAISNRSTGEILTRINELNNIKEIISNMFITLILNLFMAITSLIVLFLINKDLTIILILLIIIYLVNNIIWTKPINNLVEDNIEKETIFNSSTASILSKFISLKNSHKYPIQKNTQTLLSYILNTFHLKSLLNIYNFINQFILEIGIFIINTYAFVLMKNNSIELLDLITYNSLYIYFIEPIRDIINLIPKYIYIKRSFIKINDFLQLENENLEGNSEHFINGDICFDKVKFSYNMYDYPINNYSINIKAGNKVLVMGKSGCGKSTLFKLLFRLYELNEGNIKINNINIKDYSLNTIRNNVSYVSQDEEIYNDTILNNILLGKNIPISKLNSILYITQINEILDKKAFRLNTIITSDSSNLSEGEKARIIIARTLVKNSKIMIFDETFSSIALDDANKMINNICLKFKDYTIILISHFKPCYKFNQIIEGDFNG